MNVEETEWAKQFLKECPSFYLEALSFAKQDNLRVLLIEDDLYTDWLIVPKADPSFWLDKKQTKKEAIELCKEMKWNYE